MVQFIDKRCYLEDKSLKVILTNFGEGFSIKSHHMKGFRKYGPHVHQFVEVCCVMEGTAIVIVDGVRKDLQRGDVAVIHPYRVHYIQSKADCTMWTGVFSDRIVNSFGIQAESNFWGEDFVFSCSESLLGYISEHLPPESDEHMAVEPSSSLRYNVGAIYYGIMEEFTKKVPQTKMPAYSTALARIYEYVERNFNENISIKDVSAALGYSPKYISHVLSNVPNSNFRKILNSRRITNAKWRLLNSNDKIIDIAMLVGFTQERTFYRAFKEETKMTPYAYRKRYKG